MGSYLRQLFTGADNVTPDIGRVIWFQCTVAYIGLTIYNLYHGGTFDPMPWATGMAAILGGGGAALGLKVNTEPRPYNYSRYDDSDSYSPYDNYSRGGGGSSRRRADADEDVVVRGTSKVKVDDPDA